MKERGIIMQAESVRAILSGTKTQTRRICKQQTDEHGWVGVPGAYVPAGLTGEAVSCPYPVGTRLWVREAFCSPAKNIVGYKADAECGAWFEDGAGGHIWNPHGVLIESPAYQSRFIGDEKHTTYSIKKYGDKWRSPLFMPRWAARLWLEITAVKVERMQEISEEDALAEGMPISKTLATLIPSPVGTIRLPSATAKNFFEYRWDAVNGRGSWAANPWVWAYTFRKVEAPL